MAIAYAGLDPFCATYVKTISQCTPTSLSFEIGFMSDTRSDMTTFQRSHLPYWKSTTAPYTPSYLPRRQIHWQGIADHGPTSRRFKWLAAPTTAQLSTRDYPCSFQPQSVWSDFKGTDCSIASWHGKVRATVRLLIRSGWPR